MLVACENCQSKYEVEPNLLKQSGSRVQCPKCYDVAVVYPPAAAPLRHRKAQDRTEAKQKGTAVLVAGCAIIFIPGSLIFAFPGVMSQYWQTTFGVGKADVGQIIFYLLVSTGIFMYPSGYLLQRYSPRKLTTLGGLICGLSTVMLGYAKSMSTVYAWAFLMGISTSLIFISAMSVVQFWYPRYKGGATGLVSMIYGLAAAIMGPVFGWMLSRADYVFITWLMGMAAVIVGVLASLWIRFPKIIASPSAVGHKRSPDRSLTVSQTLKTGSFWLIWLIWALAGSAAIAFVTVGPEFGISKGMTIQRAVILLSAFNMTNGAGRLLSGYLSDIVGRKPTCCFAFLLAGLSYLGLPYMQSLILWAVASAIIGLSFGTLFGVIAALVSDCFGMKYFGAIFGLVYTAYGFSAGAIGPWLSGYILDITGGNFTAVFFYLGSLLIVSTVLITGIRRHV